MNEFKNLISVAPNQLVKNFDKISDTLMNKMALNINGNLYRIIEIEFYVKCEQHRDIFTHGDENQKLPLNWYFHRSSQKDKYAFKSGTYKGLDITIGNDDIYGGILLRSIMKINDNDDIINGPCKIVDEILSLNECKTVKDLVKDTMNDDTEIEGNEALTLQAHQYNAKEELFTSPRIGLTLKKQDNMKLRQKYISKLYRYTIFPNKITKGKKLSLLTAIDNKSDASIKKYFGLSQAKINEQKKSIKTMKEKEIDFDDYQGKSLNDNERMQLCFTK